MIGKMKFRGENMRLLLSGGTVYRDKSFSKLDISVSDGKIVSISPFISPKGFDLVFNLKSLFVFPGLVDVHVHLREPGFSYKETISSATLAAAKSGYTALCAMPNLNPAPDSPENLEKELDIIKKDALVKVIPYGTITKNRAGTELSDMEALTPYVAGFSDDGSGVSDSGLMEKAMRRAKKLGKIIAAHCEDKSLLSGGYIHAGKYAAEHSLAGISSESEWAMVKRDIALAEKTGCLYHVCHVSTKESVSIIRDAKKRGARVTCETAPHYLLLCDEDLRDDGRYKMNPPLRSRADMEALREGLADGTIDMIATDHAPHSADEKNKGLSGSAMGVTGIECAFPVLYAGLVKKGVISLEKLVSLMSVSPAEVFGLESGLDIGKNADLSVFSLGETYKIDSESFASMGKSTPFDGTEACGRCFLTLLGGKTVWADEKNIESEKPF